MGIGRLLINMEAQLEAKAEGGPVPELELVLVQAELEHVPAVALELALGQVAELELLTGLVAELERVLGLVVARRLGPVAVAPRTKLVTAAHRRGLVPVLAAEDLVAVAETTRKPAAAEAVIAWEVAE